MTIRESLEQWEKDYLSPYASLSVISVAVHIHYSEHIVVNDIVNDLLNSVQPVSVYLVVRTVSYHIKIRNRYS